MDQVLTVKSERAAAARVASVIRMASAWPNARVIHLPTHASWPDQAEIYFPVVQRTALTPNDFMTLDQICDRLAAFQTRCNAVARPFNWRFARADLDDLTTPDRRPRKDRATRPGSMISTPAETYGRDH